MTHKCPPPSCLPGLLHIIYHGSVVTHWLGHLPPLSAAVGCKNTKKGGGLCLQWCVGPHWALASALYSTTNESVPSEEHASTLCNRGIKRSGWARPRALWTLSGHFVGQVFLGFVLCECVCLAVTQCKCLDEAFKWTAWHRELCSMSLESLSPGDAFKLGVLGSVEKR